MGKRKNKIGGLKIKDLKIDEDFKFPTPEGIPIPDRPYGESVLKTIEKKIKKARESLKYLCTSCIYYDGKSEMDAFKDNDILMMFIHMQQKHQIKAPAKMTGLRETTPYSKFLLHIKGSQPPMIFKFVDSLGVEYKSYLPLLDIPAPTEDNLSLFSMNTQMGDKRVNIIVISKIIDTSELKIYSLPEMISNECEECPHCFNQEEHKIVNRVPLTGKKITQDTIMTFKCDIDLCNGIKNTYKSHLLEWNDELMDMCLEKEVELVEEVEEAKTEQNDR